MFGHRIAHALLLALSGGFASAGYAAGYITAPVVRVESGTHTGAIRALATDADNRYLVTAGADKTIRLWSQPQGQLLKTLRPPIGDKNEGRMDAIAISPDGSRIAAGGDTCRSYEEFYCLYIFDAASGAIVKRVTGFPQGITALDWSADGALLAVGLWNTGGVRVIRTSDWAETGADHNYGEWVTSLHFDGKGHLATASWDGEVRLYAHDAKGTNSLKLMAKKATSEFELPGQPSWAYRYFGKPRGLRFSPDGSKLAVGQTVGANWVTVMAADTLKTLYVPTTIGLQAIGIQNLAWSADGESLYAGTGSAVLRPLAVRKWSNGGRGGYVDLPASQSYVSGLVALKQGGVVFSAGDTVLGGYDAKGSRTLYLTAQTANFYGGTEAFRVSQNGAYVEFPYDRNTVLGFDLLERKLVSGQDKGPKTQEPVVNSGKLLFYNGWKDTRGVLVIGGTPLPSRSLETSRSLSIAPDQKSVLVGTTGYLRHYAVDGKLLWLVPTTFDAFAVNFSGDGLFAVVAIGDGTLRWYSRQSGRHLLTLFVASDKKRWVLVSPSGYYDSSVGAEDLIGWHINRGRDEAADFFPVSRLRATFYKPDVLTGIIKSGDDTEAFKLAAAALGTAAPPLTSKPTTMPVPPVATAPPAVVAPPAPKPLEATPPPVGKSSPPVSEPPSAVPPPAATAPPATGPPTGGSPPITTRPPVAAPPAAAAEPPGPSAGPLPKEDYATAFAEEAPAAPQQVSDITRVLPPVITVLAPASGSSIGSSRVTLRYTIKSDKDAPVIAVRTRVNGIGQESRGARAADTAEVREVTLEVPSEDVDILLFAENKHGVSAPVSVRLTWAGAKPAPAADARPALYVLAIGVSEYLDPENRLKFAAKDAVDFSAIVQKQKGALYGDVVVKLLTDAKASREEVLRGFDWLQQQVTPKDVGIVLIAGHGINDERGNYFYLPFDADTDRLEATGVPFNLVKRYLANLRGKGLLFVDTCHSGNVMGKRRGLSNDTTAMLNELASPEYGLVVIASSTGKQYSFESAEWGNGAFTKALVEGLGGRADLKKRGRITHKMLDFYVSDRVDELTHGQQTPVNTSPMGVPDYTIATVAAPG